MTDEHSESTSQETIWDLETNPLMILQYLLSLLSTVGIFDKKSVVYLSHLGTGYEPKFNGYFQGS